MQPLATVLGEIAEELLKNLSLDLKGLSGEWKIIEDTR